ncbi:dimethylribityllumazine synthase [Thelephora ganbajun]|uniref:Dimethylribityllumazine synthase n=1 Tax=Thelephora ganbajun TaxID=370292 RepID=A0ACB6Z3K1_THEGA|nr:dimethylribityllumazine synthase [Thelephora ganbajun]
MSDPTIKGILFSESSLDGSSLRIAIVHARWNKPVIDVLLQGAISKLKAVGVKENNIVVQSVPGSYELPIAVSKVITGSRVQAGATATDLLGGLNFGSPLPSRTTTPAPNSASTTTNPPPTVVTTTSSQPFDAVIAIGVLIKGETMHFEYISDTVSHGLMRVQLDTGVPVVFGVLTALTENQALVRAGIGKGQNKGHNHGEDWGLAAVEMAVSSRRWSEGKFQ